MKITFFRFILTRFTPILCFFAWNCGILGCFCNYLVINYIIIGKKQYYERLWSPWCIKYFFHRLFFCFFVHFLPCFAPNKGLEWGWKSFWHQKSNFFWYLNNISYHIELSLCHFLQTLSIEKLSKILGSNGPRTG